MMIPYGYKQTEVGVIPEDWSVSALEKLYNITSSKRVFQSQWRKSGVPFYRAREIAVMSEGKIAPEDLYIDESLYNQYIHQYGSINKNDILITGVGTLGKVYVVKENDRFYFKDGNIIWLQAKHDFSSIYLKYQYDMPALINQVFGNAGGSTVATYTITNAKTTKVPVPPLPEQQRIAEALSDADGMISSLEKLVAKYKSIKTACLQQMFPQNGETVPRMRLPGFTGAWEQRKLSELTSMHARIGWQNLRTSEFLDSGDYMLITGTDFNDGTINFSTCHYVERERYEQDRNIQIHNGSILITKDGTLGKVAYVQGLSLPATLNAGVFNVQIKDANSVDEKYLFQYLKAPFLMDYVDKKATGGTIKHLNQNILVDFPVILPQRSEQILIGAFFQQLDNLITLHQRKLEKVQKIKQGMMQQLLTGKIRLV